MNSLMIFGLSIVAIIITVVIVFLMKLRKPKEASVSREEMKKDIHRHKELIKEVASAKFAAEIALKNALELEERERYTRELILKNEKNLGLFDKLLLAVS